MSLKPDYKQTEIGVIPESWEEVRLGDIGYIFGGLTGKSSEDFGTGNANYITFMNVISNVVSKESGVEKVSVGAGEHQSAVLPGDVLFNGSSETPEEVGFGSVVPEALAGTYLNSFCFGFRPNKDSDLDSKFFAYLTRSSLGREIIRPMAQGSTRYNLAKTNLLNGRFPRPPVKEQKAIAEALSDVDALIDSLEALLTKKRNIKTGVMQELLTGRTRLSGFTGDWEIAKFGSICRRRRESGVPTAESFVIELEHIESGSGRLVGESSVQTVSSKRVFQRGDVLFGRLRSYLRKYWLAEREGFCSTEIWALVPENERVEPGFLFQIVRLDEFITATGISYGTHMPRSDWSTIKEWPFPLPPIKEQEAIAAVLSDIDDEIEALEKRLAKTRDLKQGMAQELLTGRTRLV